VISVRVLSEKYQANYSFLDYHLDNMERQSPVLEADINQGVGQGIVPTLIGIAVECAKDVFKEVIPDELKSRNPVEQKTVTQPMLLVIKDNNRLENVRSELQSLAPAPVEHHGRVAV